MKRHKAEPQPSISIDESEAARDIVAQAVNVEQTGDGNVAIGAISNSFVDLSTIVGAEARAIDFATTPQQFVDSIARRSKVDLQPRSTLLDLFDKFVQQTDSGVLLIEGPAGSGKSMLLAQAADRVGVIAHAATPGDRHRGALNLLAQLKVLRDPESHLPPGVTTSFDACAQALKGELFALDGRSLTVIVDGAPGLQGSLASHLYGVPDPLPSGIHILFASRPGLTLDRSGELLVVTLDDARYWRDELADFIAKQLGDRNQGDPDLVRQIVEASGGSWLLASFLLERVRTDGDEVPSGPQSISDNLARHIATEVALLDNNGVVLKYLALCCVTLGPVPAALLNTLGSEPSDSTVDLALKASGSDLLVLDGGVLDVRHGLILEAVTNPTEGLSVGERENLANVDVAGRILASRLAAGSHDPESDFSNQSSGHLEAAVLLMCVLVADGMAPFCSTLYGAGDWSSTGGRSLRTKMEQTESGRWLEFVTRLRSRVSLSFALHVGDDGTLAASILAVGNVLRSMLGRLESVGALALASLHRRGLVDERDMTVALGDYSDTDVLKAVSQSHGPTPGDYDFWSGSGSRLIPPLRRDAGDVLPASNSLLLFAFGRFRGASIDSKAEFLQSLLDSAVTTSIEFGPLIEAETDPYIRILLCCLAHRAGETSSDIIQIATRELSLLRGISRVRALARLNRDLPRDEWLDELAEVLAGGRLGFYGPLSGRVLLEVARMQEGALRVQLADDAISLSCASDSPKWLPVTGAVLRSASAVASGAGVREALAFMSERDLAAAIEVAQGVSLNPDEGAVSLAFDWSRALPAEVAGYASIPLAARLASLGVDVDEEALLASFEELSPSDRARTMASAADFELLRSHLLGLDPSDLPSYVDRAEYMRALSPWLNAEEIGSWLDGVPEIMGRSAVGPRANVFRRAHAGALEEVIGRLELNSDRASVMRSRALASISAGMSMPMQDVLRGALGEFTDDDVAVLLEAMEHCPPPAAGILYQRALESTSPYALVNCLVRVGSMSGVANDVEPVAAKALEELLNSESAPTLPLDFFRLVSSPAVARLVRSGSGSARDSVRVAANQERVLGAVTTDVFARCIDQIGAELAIANDVGIVDRLLQDFEGLLGLSRESGVVDEVTRLISLTRDGDAGLAVASISIAAGVWDESILAGWHAGVAAADEMVALLALDGFAGREVPPALVISPQAWWSLFDHALAAGEGSSGLGRLSFALEDPGERMAAQSRVGKELGVFAPLEVRDTAAVFWSGAPDVMAKAVEGIAGGYATEDLIVDVSEGCWTASLGVVDRMWGVLVEYPNEVRAKVMAEMSPVVPFVRDDFWLDFLGAVSALRRDLCFDLVARSLHRSEQRDSFRRAFVDLVATAAEGLP